MWNATYTTELKKISLMNDADIQNFFTISYPWSSTTGKSRRIVLVLRVIRYTCLERYTQGSIYSVVSLIDASVERLRNNNARHVAVFSTKATLDAIYSQTTQCVWDDTYNTDRS